MQRKLRKTTSPKNPITLIALIYISLALALFFTLLPSPAEAQITFDSGQIFKPLRICTLVNTAATGDKYSDGETRTYLIRGESNDLSSYGGEAGGCGLPGLTPGLMAQNRVSAIAVNIKTLGIEGRGSVKVWPADEVDTPLPINNYDANDPPLKFNNFAIIPICDEVGATPCATGDVNVQVNGAGAHVKLEVTGYFVDMTQNTVRVAVPGGDFLTIQDALDALATVASPTDPWVIEVGPGTFTEAGPIVLEPGISVVGSGAGSTVITTDSDVMVIGSDDAQLASLTLRKETGGDLVGLLNQDADTVVENVVIEVSGGSSSNVAIFNDGSAPAFLNLTAIALGVDGVAILNEASSAPVIRNSKLEGAVDAVVNEVGCEATLVSTQVIGGTSGLGLQCVGSFNGVFSLLNSLCLGLL